MALNDRSVYFETLSLGDHAKVCAIDAATGIEVSVIGPAGAARHDLERLALRKLERALIAAGVLEETDVTQLPSGQLPPGETGGAAGKGRRGRLV